jgi:hypothetical protein
LENWHKNQRSKNKEQKKIYSKGKIKPKTHTFNDADISSDYIGSNESKISEQKWSECGRKWW